MDWRFEENSRKGSMSRREARIEISLEVGAGVEIAKEKEIE